MQQIFNNFCTISVYFPVKPRFLLAAIRTVFFRRLAANDCVQLQLIVQSQKGLDMNKNGSIGIDSQLSDQVDDDN